MLPHGHIAIRRHACLLCSRTLSQDVSATTVKDETQDIEQTNVRTKERSPEWKTLSGVPPFWIKTPIPMWKAAYAKLLIPAPKTDVPTVSYGGIEVPRKVKRDSVTILKALSETTQFDDLSVNYNFMDDNMLYQVRFKDRVMNAKVEGKKTAHQMMNMYKECFMDFKAQPDIPAFNPGSVEYEDKSLSVNALEERIKKRKVSHAMEIYDRLMEKGVEIPVEVEEKMLEVLCVFNGKDPDTETGVPFVTKRASDRQEPGGWNAELADKIFQKHTESNTLTPFMYNVYICGLIKHSTRAKSEGRKAFKLYTEMKQKDIPVFMCTFNMIMLLNNMPETLLKDMKKAGVVPNSETFVNALSSKFNRRHNVPSFLAEMKKAGIGLDFRHMLHLHKAAPNDLKFNEELIDFMAEQKTWYIDPSGANVFLEMMRRLRNIDRQEVMANARKLYKLRKEMGVRFKINDPSQDNFFSNYFYIALSYAPFEEFKQIYKELVPLHVVPGLQLIFARMEKEKGHGDFLITLYEDVFNFIPIQWAALARLLDSVNVIFQKMLEDQHSPELKKQFADVASFFFSEYILPELEFQGNVKKKQLLSSDVVKTSLELMLQEPSYLDKTWKYYMAYADTSIQLFKRQVISWEKIFQQAVEVEDIPKIRMYVRKVVSGFGKKVVSVGVRKPGNTWQFLNKIKISSSWANHDFLRGMRKQLEKILGPEEREMLDSILSSKQRK